VCFGLGVIACIVWLSISLIHNGYQIVATWKSTFDSFLMLIGGGAGLETLHSINTSNNSGNNNGQEQNKEERAAEAGTGRTEAKN